MMYSAEISFYPLAQAEYKEHIWQFIDQLKVAGLRVETNGLSTQVFGDYDLVMSTLTKEIKLAHQRIGASVFVLKLVPGDRSEVEAR